MNKLTLQIKILILALVLVLIPVIGANLIFSRAAAIFASRGVISGTRSISSQLEAMGRTPVLEDIQAMSLEEFQVAEDSEEEPYTEQQLKDLKNQALEDAMSKIDIKAQEAMILDEFVGSKLAELVKLDDGLKALELSVRIFYIGSMIFVPFSLFILWFFMNQASTPIKEVVEKLKSFQNEGGENNQTDMLECAIQFDSFLATARTILQESYSIAQELSRKLEPLTAMSVFSDENVRQFFTDVQEITRSSNYIANTLESTTSHIQEVSASAQTIADRSHEAATDSAETAAIAGEGKNAVSETIDTMESIKDEVLGLEDVIENLRDAAQYAREFAREIMEQPQALVRGAKPQGRQSP